MKVGKCVIQFNRPIHIFHSDFAHINYFGVRLLQIYIGILSLNYQTTAQHISTHNKYYSTQIQKFHFLGFL